VELPGGKIEFATRHFRGRRVERQLREHLSLPDVVERGHVNFGYYPFEITVRAGVRHRKGTIFHRAVATSLGQLIAIARRRLPRVKQSAPCSRSDMGIRA